MIYIFRADRMSSIFEKSAACMNERKQQIESEQNEIQKAFGFL